MIYDIPIPGSAGSGATIPYNIGQMSNRGLEFMANYNGNIGREIKFNVAVNGAFNSNKLISLNPDLGGVFFDGGLNEIYSYSTATKTEPGKPLGQFFGWVANGIYQTDREATAGPKVQGDVLYQPRAGDLIYKDLDGDGKINENDKQYIGNPWPKLHYGISLGIQYKGFDANMLFSGLNGVDIYNGQESFNYLLFGDYNTTADIFKTSFFDGNGVTDVPRSFYPQGSSNGGGKDPNGNWTKVSSYHVQNGSFIRLSNLQVGYSLSGTVVKKLFITSARFFVMGNNLFTITKYKGYSPDIAGFVRSRGIDLSSVQYPNTRLWALGLNINF